MKIEDTTISRQAAIDAIYKCTDIYVNNLPVMIDKADAYKALADLPPAQPEIIMCADCRKHNISPRRSPEDCCPLYHYRGMSFGSEHDLQFCSFAERRTDE